MWKKKEYIKDRTQYYKENHQLTLKLAVECAKEDWERYIEKYANDDKGEKYYSFETLWGSEADKLRHFLKTNKFKYELSGVGDGYHFEILLSPADKILVDNFIESDCLNTGGDW